MAEQLSMWDIKTPKYAVLDFETGGLNEKTCGLASVGVIRLDENLQEVDRDYFLMYEEDKVYEQGALDVNQLALAQLQAEGVRPEQFIPRLHELVDGLIMVNHNSSFDCKWARRIGIDVSKSVCTMELSMKKWPGKKAKLGIVYNRVFGSDFSGAHNALNDVQATVDLFKWFYSQDRYSVVPQEINWNRFK